MLKADNLPPSCAVVTKSGNLNFLEPSGPVQACNETDLPLPLPLHSLMMENEVFFSMVTDRRTLIVISQARRDMIALSGCYFVPDVTWDIIRDKNLPFAIEEKIKFNTLWNLGEKCANFPKFIIAAPPPPPPRLLNGES